MARDLAGLAARLQEYANTPLTTNLLRQAHARKMMIELGSVAAEWPNFSDRLDESLHFGASDLINGGVELLNTEYSDLAKTFLFAGAEALEFLVASTETYRGSVLDEKLRSAAAYYLAGHHARAYVILERELEDTAELGPLEQLVALLLKQDMRAAQQVVRGILVNESYSDPTLASGAESGDLNWDEIIGRICIKSLAQSSLSYLEHLRTGDEQSLIEAQQRISSVVSLSLESRFADIWWWSRVIALLFEEMRSTSLWTNLGPLMPPGQDNGLIRSYILAATQRNICTLWPSQLTALQKVCEPTRSSFCVRMPTSAGKTRIAEIAILTSFKDHLGANPKCIYIAPFRSLAVEVERTLRDAFGPLGIAVSELYGGYDFSESESEVIASVSILVVTPEKLDAMLRFAPELFESVKCVVVDEGHTAGETNERGLRAEFVINRLLRRLPRNVCRYVFASAVLPNAEDFARWIGGTDDSLVSSDWRPSRQMIGEIRWRKGHSTRIDYTHAGHRPFDTECFVPRFIEQVPGLGRRRRPFPADSREAVALSAIRLSNQGTVLLFIPQRQHVESSARDVLECLALEEQYHPDRSLAHLTVDEQRPEVSTCLDAIRKCLGPDSTIERCARRGIAVHHGSLPRQLRQPMEKFIGSGLAHIIVATNTLAQGVNLPIRSVLVKGLWQGKGRRVDALAFWNICGRAGRGMRENEGQILFFMDLDRKSWQVREDRTYNMNLVEQPKAASIMGVLYLLLRALKAQWLQQIPEVSFEGICERLASNDFSWMDEQRAERIEAWFRLLDDQLFALLSENLEEGELADTLEAVLSDSLLSIQLDSMPIDGIDSVAASKAISARLNFVRHRIPDRIQRDRFYKLGLPIDDCLQLHASLPELNELTADLHNWSDWNTDARADWIGRFVDWSLTMSFAEVDEDKKAAIKELTLGWMKGASFVELFAIVELRPIGASPQELGAEVESFCVFRLAWLANAVATYVKATTEGGLIPAMLAALPAMFKYGTLSPLATTFAPFLDQDRGLAELVANICPFAYGDAACFGWFRGLDVESLVQAGVEHGVCEQILSARERILRSQAALGIEQDHACALEILSLATELGEHLSVIAVPVRGNGEVTLKLLTASGVSIGHFKPIDHDVLETWFDWVNVTMSLAVHEGVPTLEWNNLK